jgi:hypothetical protein
VKADGEIISTILSLCGELVFARPTNMQRYKFDATPISSNGLTSRSRQPLSQLQNRDDRCLRAEIFSEPFH